MRIASVVPCLALLLAGAATAQQPGALLSPEGALSISKAEAPLLFRQCSRQAPVPEGGLWLPSTAEVVALEARVAKHLAALPTGAQVRPASSVQYRGQYVGFMRGGVRLIYASFNPSNAGPFPIGRAMRVCDGGSLYWGIVYNPASGEFSDLRINGPG